MELFDLGTSNISSGITFRTPSKDDKNKEQFSDSRTLGRDIRETKDFTSSGSVSILFENTSSTEKTISHYFGFFSGCRYGSKYTHQVEAKCALSFDKLVDGDTISPQISYNSNDARYNINHTLKDTYSKDQFYPDVVSTTLTDSDFKAMGCDPSGYISDYRDFWKNCKLKLSADTNKLTFSQTSAWTQHSVMAYVPFTVPIKVPAYAKRTYYLTFKIDFVKNSASGAGFFAELIEGGVPSSFNTADSANMTGNTKLRVFTSDTGNKTKTFSGTVTVPLTLKNDTNSAKTMYGNYVFFAGFRKVGAYQPNSVFNLTLTDIGYASYEDDYYAEVNASNCTYTHNQTITPGSDYNATITANTGYSLPSTITVKCGGTTMAASKYTWNSSTGKLTIASKNITGGIVVTANGVPNTYSITYSGLDGATLSTKPTTHTYGTATTVGNPTKTGYTFAGWKVNGGSSATKSLSLGATSYTANISLEATWTVNKYNATLGGSNVSTTSGFGTSAVTYNTEWTGKFTANTGYDLPSSITVTSGGTTLTSSQYTYTKNGSTGTVKISAANVTGAVAITAGGTAKMFSITYSGLDGATLSSSNKPTTHTYGTATSIGNPTKTGYTFAGWRVNGSSTATKSLSLGATAYTANITLEATWTANTYSATFSGTNTASSSGFGTGKVTYNTAWTGKFTANTGYDLPSSVTVKVGSTTLTTSQYTYSKSGSTGTVTITAANVTGAVTVTAVGTAKKYDATLSGTNVTASSGFGTGTATYKTAWTGTITAASGYVLPDSVTVKVGSTTLSSGYTYTKSTGKITVTAANVTGAITVTAAGHKHSYTSTVTTAATCTTTGVRTYTCACGDSYTSTISKTAHTYSDAWTTSTTQHWHICAKCGTAGTKSAHAWNSGEITIEPTETSTGVKTFTCNTCSKTKTETLAMLEHTHKTTPDWNGKDDDEHWHECDCGEKVDPEPHTLKETCHQDPTCTESGWTKYVCEVCQGEITKEIDATGHDFADEWQKNLTNHYHICTVCKANVDTEEHDWVIDSVAHEPDCTNTGLCARRCKVCGLIDGNAVLAVDTNAHDWGDWVIAADPTTENEGTIKRVCNINSEHVETEKLPALNNTGFWKMINSTEPTCTENGSETYECEYGQVTVATAAKGHTPVVGERVAPTCTEKGWTAGSYCDVCGEVITEQTGIDPLGHDWDKDNGEITTQPGCTEKGSQTFSCKRCDATHFEDVPAKGHTEATDSAVVAACTETGLTEGKHCSVCDAVIVEQTVVKALGHNWNNGEITKQPSCIEEGVRTFSCTRCTEKRTEDIPIVKHTETADNAVAPTCTEKGKTAGSHCSVCGKIIKAQQNIPALGHSWDDGVVTIEPGEDTPGERTRTCTVCGEVKTEPIAPLNHTHDWDTEWSADDTYHWYDCLNGCDEKKDEAAHSWDAGKVTKKPTADAEGEKTFECKVCGEAKTEPIPITDEIDAGNISKEVQPGENVPETKLETPLAELVGAVLTADEQEIVEEGIDIKILLTVEDATDKVSAADKTAVERAIGALTNYKQGQYLDVNLFKVINGVQNPITETKAALTITFEIPAGLRGSGRTYSVIRVHNGETKVLNDLDSDPNTITIETDKFSTYALTYHENKSYTSKGGSVSARDESTHIPSAGGYNPQTGIAISPFPFITALAVVCVAVIRRRK